MIHFYVHQSDASTYLCYYRDSDLAGGSFVSPTLMIPRNKFTFTYGGRPWPEFIKDHAGYKSLFSVSNDYTPQQFIQDFPELFL